MLGKEELDYPVRELRLRTISLDVRGLKANKAQVTCIFRQATVRTDHADLDWPRLGSDGRR